MDKLDQKNRGTNGTKSLTFFMDSIEEREVIREELKDHFEILLFYTIRNSLYFCFHKWRTVSPKCSFDSLLKAVEKEYNLYVRNNFKLQSMKDWKQGDDEPVQEYNKRYRERLTELYPDFKNMPYRRANENSGQTNFLKMEVVGNYIAGPKNELRYMMSVFNGNEKMSGYCNDKC